MTHPYRSGASQSVETSWTLEQRTCPGSMQQSSTIINIYWHCNIDSLQKSTQKQHHQNSMTKSNWPKESGAVFLKLLCSGPQWCLALVLEGPMPSAQVPCPIYTTDISFFSGTSRAIKILRCLIWYSLHVAYISLTIKKKLFVLDFVFHCRYLSIGSMPVQIYFHIWIEGLVWQYYNFIHFHISLHRNEWRCNRHRAA